MKKVQINGESLDAIEVDFKVIHEPWSTYELSDGTKLRWRSTVSEVLLVQGKLNPDGSQAYFVASSNSLVASTPETNKKVH